MRHFVTPLVLLFLGQLTPPAWANSLPESYGYTIFMRGERVGHSNTRVTASADALVLDSTTRVQFTPTDSLVMTCRTVADSETYLIRSFEFDGQRGPSKTSGFITVDGDSLHGTVSRGSSEAEDYKVSPFEYNLLLEDYIMDHEVLIARTHNTRVDSGREAREYGLFFPNGLMLTSAQIAFASTAEMQSDTQAAVCRKLVISITGSEPFVSYYDPERGMPVYLAFPQTLVEVFLDDFFGETPASRYR